MKVIQVLPTLAYGDAVGNETIAFYHVLENAGFDTEIYTERLDPRIKNLKIRSILEWEEPETDDVLIYHIAISWNFLFRVIQAQCRKIGVYHNITPPHWFKPYNKAAYMGCSEGYRQVRGLKDVFDFCIADSEYNKQQLLSFGFTCDIEVVPIILPLDDYRKEPDQEVIRKCKARGGANILFVGRVVPNKKLEDIIAAFAIFQKVYDHEASLNLVGNAPDGDPYFGRLEGYVKKLGVRNVFFSGHVSFAEILGYYASADLFLCMSEHEGFCVPLVEAMLFHVPIIAYNEGAVGETLGEGGILLERKDFAETAAFMSYVLKHGDIRERMIQNQERCLEKYSEEKNTRLFLDLLRRFIDQKR